MKSMLLTGVCVMISSVAVIAKESAVPSYREWRDACGKLPTNRELRENEQSKAPKELLPIKNFASMKNFWMRSLHRPRRIRRGSDWGEG
ncbi:MAG: hypothetical protein V4733_06320 [Verrucomicrobiota bacterium]